MIQPNLEFLILAVDFDGTIVEHKYPEIGREIPFALQTIKKLQDEGHKIILWTYRSGIELDEAVEYCKQAGVEFYAVNRNNPDEEFDPNIMSRKIVANFYIDDRNIGGLYAWGEIYQMLGREKVDLNLKQPVDTKTFIEKLKTLFS